MKFSVLNEFRLGIFSDNILSMAQQTLVGYRLPIIGVSRSYSDTSHSDTP